MWATQVMRARLWVCFVGGRRRAVIAKFSKKLALSQLPDALQADA